jgi:exoribonuclease-2
MLDRGFWPDFNAAAETELANIRGPAAPDGIEIRDLRELPWCSIDNDDSRDLDQITVRSDDSGAADAARILVAIADVDALVPKDSAIDQHARHNTTTVYTPAVNFLLIPERLSTNLTSLAEGEDRLAMVVEMTVSPDGSVTASDIYRGWVRNKAQLAYDSVSAWMDGEGPVPPAVRRVSGLAEQLKAQDEVARTLRKQRLERGALDLETLEPKATFDGSRLRGLRIQPKNRARRLIEDFMIAANEATVRFLEARHAPLIRRVVREPERWPRIVEIARDSGFQLPPSPDAAALQEFLQERREADPLRFPDLSLTIVKLLGSGEYVAEGSEGGALGHFGLAIRGYTHATAPNRRYPDVILQRLLKAAQAGARPPYSIAQLRELAKHCTEQEDEADRVERQMRKSAAALLLAPHVGERFDAIVTGASNKGTWVRILNPPAEGKVVRGEEGLEVGQRLRVELVNTDVERGYIDFARR